jgi:hypothetical protein
LQKLWKSWRTNFGTIFAWGIWELNLMGPEDKKIEQYLKTHILKIGAGVVNSGRIYIFAAGIADGILY